MSKFKTKRAYEPPGPDDGVRILVDRIWPRGLSKDKLRIDYWAKDIAPSTSLRKWYKHDPEKWDEFKQRYFDELNSNLSAVDTLMNQIEVEVVTLVYASKEKKLNNANALIDYLKTHS